MNINSRIPLWARFILAFVAAMLIGQVAGTSLPTATAAPSSDVVADVQQDVASGNLMGILELLFPITPAIAPATTPVRASAEAKSVDLSMPVVQYVGGTGNGQAGPIVVQDGVQYVPAAYAASIFGSMRTPWGPLNVPAPWGPLSYGDSTVQGARQAVVNAAADPNPEYRGFSQGESAAWIASATDGKVSHLTGYGSPTNPGTGFVSSMPGNLLLTQIGDPPAMQPGDTADLYSASGDCWTNLPPLWSLWSWPACIPSTVKEHYGNTYNEFREDATYESSPGVMQHVMYTENGYVIAAEDWLHLDLNEDQKQFLRDFAPQGQPGIQEGPTLREIVEDPMAAVVSTVEAIAPGLVGNAPQADSIPQADAIPLEMPLDQNDQFQQYVDQGIEDAATYANDWAASTGDPVVQEFVGNAVEQFDTFVDNAFNGGGNIAQNDYVAPANTDQGAYEAPVFTAPVGDLGNVVNQFNDIVGQFNGLLAGAH